MTRNIVVVGVGLAALVGVAGCEGEATQPGNIPGGAETGMLRVLLGSETSASQIDPRVEEVWVRIDSVEARHEDEGWVTISDERQDFDLMSGASEMAGDDGGDDGREGGGRPGGGGPGYAVGGADDGDVGGVIDLEAYEPIGEGEVWTGGYNKLHLGVADAWIMVDGQQQDLEFIGNIDPLDPFDAGLTVNESFFVDKGSVTTASIRWDVGNNLTEKSNGRWMLGADAGLDVDIDDGRAD